MDSVRKVRGLALAALSVATLLAGAGCGITYPRSLVVEPRGVRLQAIGFDWVATAGDTADVPTEHVRTEGGGGGLCLDDTSDMPAVEPFERALTEPTRIIYLEVAHPALAEGESLYGALVLCGLWDPPPSVDVETYQIEIPEDYVRSALAGERSFVSETYYPHSNSAGGQVMERIYALWLQREPFAQAAR